MNRENARRSRAQSLLAAGYLSAASCVLLLSACGGGGGGSGGSTTQASSAQLTIAAQPTDQSVVAGGSATFTVSTSGDVTSYKWQSSSDGVNWGDVPGNTSSTLIVTSVQQSQNGVRYRVVVAGPNNSVTSSAVTLSVQPLTAPTIGTPPVSTSVVEGNGAQFNVSATGTSVTYQWQVSSDGGTTWTSVSGAAGTTLTISTVNLSQGGERFRVLVSNSAGSVTSPIATLTVTPMPAAPVVLVAPRGASVVAPGIANFSVSGAGSPAPSYQWQLSTDGGALYNNIPGATGTTYSTPATSTADSGRKYRAVLTNSVASTTTPSAALTVSAAGVAPTITTPPSDVTVRPTATALFGVLSESVPAATYQWQVSTNGGSSFSNVNGATQAAYVTPATALTDNGEQFRVIVTNSVGSVTSAPATLTVDPSSSVPQGRLAISAGSGLLLRDDGTVLSLGVGTPGVRGEWLLGTAATPVSGAFSIDSVSTYCDFPAFLQQGNCYSVGTRSDGTLQAWGRTYQVSGGLGIINPTAFANLPAPAVITQITGAVQTRILAGGATLVRLSNGTVWLLGGSTGYVASTSGTTYFDNPVQVAANISWIGDAAMSGYDGLFRMQSLVPLVTASGAISMLLVSPASLSSGGIVTAGGTNTATYAATFTLTPLAGVSGASRAACSGTTSSNYHCVALTTGGAVWTWGNGNGAGELGNGTSIASGTPSLISGLNNVFSIAASPNCGFAVTTGGNVYSWGRSQTWAYCLGYSQPNNALSPQLIPGLSGVVDIVASSLRAAPEFSANYEGYDLVLALKGDGTVWGWGYNEFGELGTGDQRVRYLPSQVRGVTLH